MTNETLTGLQQGSRQAFSEMYEQYFDLLYGFVFGLIHSHTAAREIVQDVFVKVWINRERINSAQSFKAYLFAIAKNQLINRLKLQFRNPLFEDYLQHCYDEQLSVLPQESYDFDQFLFALAEAKKELTPRQCEAFELYLEEGLSAFEASSHMGISEQAFYNHFSKALAGLRSRLRPFAPVLFFMSFFSSR